MILVTGATGASGSAVIREFARRELPVRALVRDRARLVRAGVPSGVEVARGDMLEPETLRSALEGVETALMISSADQRLVDTQRCFIDAAKRSGVRHMVKFSGRGCRSDSEFRFARMHAEIEQYLERSGLAWTHLRPGQFMHVYFREVPTIIHDRMLRLPMANARLSPVDVEDIAKVAVSLLHSEGHEGKRYEMTGPEALTMGEVAETISGVTDKPIRYVDVDPDEKNKELLAAGIPAFFAEAMDELFSSRRKNLEEARVDLSTHEAFDVRPTSFESFVHRHLEVFRGQAAPTHLWASGWLPEQ
jgi:uncharacterized protein YbjT (DUF2867 family)